MNRGGDCGARDDDAHEVDLSAQRTHDQGSAKPRQWTHPSEIGLETRVHVDRRRGHALVIGLIAVGVGVLVGTAAMATVLSGSDRTVSTESVDVAPSDSLALVDVIDGGDSTHVTGLLVDDGHHVLVAADGLDAAGLAATGHGHRRNDLGPASDADLEPDAIRP